MALKLWRLRSRARADTPGPVVRAAGGVVRRRSKNGRTDYALVHRPRYDDWSLPKGKLDPGETDEEAAEREVEEETGVRANLLTELSSIRYADRKGRQKQVRYWLMEPADGKAPQFAPTNEVDEVRWCPADEAGKLLDHEHDRKLIAEAEALP